MSVILEKRWKSALTSILEELERTQLTKLLECLDKIPQSQKTGRHREKMPRNIIQHYGLQESVSAIRDALDQIPRRDSAVQDLLRPFVDKLKSEHEKENKGKKRRRDPDEEGGGSAADHQKRCRPDEERSTRPWRKFICDLKSSGELHEKAIVGKVVQKSGMRTYQTRDRVKKFFFYVAVADETASVKVMVYGKQRYEELQEENFYLFRNLMTDKGCFKVTAQSKVSQTMSFKVPEKFEMEAQELIYSKSPVCTIAKAKLFADPTGVSVEGSVTEIDPAGKCGQKKRQHFQLQDDTDSIGICMWGEGTGQCRGLAVGDVIKVANVRTSLYYGTVSLSSTGLTRIHKVHSAGVQTVRIEIIGIIKANKRETHLEAEFNHQMHTFVVSSQRLAKAFGFTLEADFKERLLDKMPLSADAVIQGSQIKNITAA